MILIPARLASTRFPRKLLADIGGLPMVVRTARNAQAVDEVVVACAEQELVNLCTDFDLKAVLTDPNHPSGTDRCAQACQILKLPLHTPVLNLQADEPFLEPEIIALLLDEAQSTEFMHTCIKVISEEEAHSNAVVKVVLGKKHALYFSRSIIPCDRDQIGRTLYGHIGIYGFQAATLLEFCALPKSPLEEIEKLEQLRALYHHKPIGTSLVETSSIGIDTPEDLALALKRC
ncbi:3-deoxy-manno-octulosonate cytidylyltransferase [Helicobacter felis]|uniref:3-deoxy-manno-octulosonate cytidylyltransferase n=1 Tax=Helicobacter felis TaxID=214 RepID=UPI000CF1B81F|nr:3-deoxy-manno-octulosonate cytidylyltransferase [Helicobacter felis]